MGISPVLWRPDGLVGIKGLAAHGLGVVQQSHPGQEGRSGLIVWRTRKMLSAQEFLQYMIGVLKVQFVKMEPVPWLEQRKCETAAQNRPGSQSTVPMGWSGSFFR